jgi:hypothetical protein
MKANPQTAPNETSRTVLMVDGHGRIRTIHKFHQKLGIGIALVILALLGAAGAFWMYADGLHIQTELQGQIDALRAKVAEAEHQKELLLARAVKAEARVAASDPQGNASSAPQVTPPEAPAKAKDKRPAPKSSPTAAAPVIDAKTVKPAPPKPEPAPKPEPVIGVAVDKFKVGYRETEKSLTANFIIRNTGNTQAQGRTVVVLSKKDNATAPRLTIPPVPLRDDRPRGNRGRRFSITRFMQVKLQRKVAEPGLQFDSADVFVFDMQGKLLQEETFEVAVRVPEEKPPAPAAVQPPVAPPAPAAAQPPVEPPASAAAEQPIEPAATTPDQNPDQIPEQIPVGNSILAIPANDGQETQGGQEE